MRCGRQRTQDEFPAGFCCGLNLELLAGRQYHIGNISPSKATPSRVQRLAHTSWLRVHSPVTLLSLMPVGRSATRRRPVNFHERQQSPRNNATKPTRLP